MYLEKWFEAVAESLNAIRTTQGAQIEAAAEIVANSLADKGAIFVMDTGHLLQHETHIRAGGLMAIIPFAYKFEVEDEVKLRVKSLPSEISTPQITLALDMATIRPGDVMVLNSNSGRSMDVVETAIQCQARGIHTIGLASTAQMSRCEAQHPSGKKLCEVVDVAIDNQSPYGDGAVAVTDNENMCPLSGINSAILFWAIQAAAVEKLEQRGIQPTIHRSVHVSGQEYIDAQRARFMERGY